MEALRHRTVGEESPDAAGERSRDAERVGGAFAVELQKLRRARRGAEGAARSARMPSEIVVETIPAGAFGHAGGDVVARDDRRQHVFAADAATTRKREHRGS